MSTAFPRWIIIFQGLVALDLASHYVHMYATLSSGTNESHKNVDKSTSRILNLYYTNKSVLFTVCALNEVFFIALYLLSFSSPLLSPSLLKQVPGAQAIHHGDEASSSVIKQLFTSPYSAGALELARANKMVSQPCARTSLCGTPVLGYDCWANTQLFRIRPFLGSSPALASRSWP